MTEVRRYTLLQSVKYESNTSSETFGAFVIPAGQVVVSAVDYDNLQARLAAREALVDKYNVLQSHHSVCAGWLKSYEALQARLAASEALVRKMETEREHLRMQAIEHAQEMRTQRAIVRDIYQAVSGATGEPGNWNGAEPVKQLVRQLATLTEAVMDYCDSLDKGACADVSKLLALRAEMGE